MATYSPSANQFMNLEPKVAVTRHDIPIKWPLINKPLLWWCSQSGYVQTIVVCPVYNSVFMWPGFYITKRSCAQNVNSYCFNQDFLIKVRLKVCKCHDSNIMSCWCVQACITTMAHSQTPQECQHGWQQPRGSVYFERGQNIINISV